MVYKILRIKYSRGYGGSFAVSKTDEEGNCIWSNAILLPCSEEVRNGTNYFTKDFKNKFFEAKKNLDATSWEEVKANARR